MKQLACALLEVKKKKKKKKKNRRVKGQTTEEQCSHCVVIPNKRLGTYKSVNKNST